MTATQLAKRHEINPSTCMSMLTELAKHGWLKCMNPNATCSRLFWLTEHGKRMQTQLRDRFGDRPISHDLPTIDWHEYGFVCFSHRSAIVGVLTHPLQAAAVKRLARKRWPGIPMSANNVRDALRLLDKRGIVERVVIPKKSHPHFILANNCSDFPRLLQHAAWGGSFN